MQYIYIYICKVGLYTPHAPGLLIRGICSFAWFLLGFREKMHSSADQKPGADQGHPGNTSGCTCRCHCMDMYANIHVVVHTYMYAQMVEYVDVEKDMYSIIPGHVCVNADTQ